MNHKCGEFTIEWVGGRVVAGEGGVWEGWRGQSYASHNLSAACGLRHAVTTKWTEFPGLQPRGSAPVASPLAPGLARPTAHRTSLGSRMRKPQRKAQARPCGQHGVRRLASSRVARCCCGWLSRSGRPGFSKPLIRFPSSVGPDAKFSLFADSSERKIVQHSKGRGDVCCGMLISLVARLSMCFELVVGT